jgi:hypothetical protein
MKIVVPKEHNSPPTTAFVICSAFLSDRLIKINNNMGAKED